MKKPKHYASIEEDLFVLQQKGQASCLSIGEILETLSERRHPLMILLLSLPFCQPIQIPGFSIPFGVAIAFIGLKMVFGEYAWLPKKVLEQTVTPHALQKIAESLLWFLKKIERWVHPRLVWVCHDPVFQIVNGLLIFILGILLALPLPIPMSNLIVSWSILFIGLGMLKDDGLFILIGYSISLATFALFVTAFLLLKHVL